MKRLICQVRAAWSRERRSDQRAEPVQGELHNYLEEEGGLLSNRSIPRVIVISVWAYLRIGNHRAQLMLGTER